MWRITKERVKEQVFDNVFWNIAEQTISFTRKGVHLISINKKIIWLKIFLAKN